ncbi:hypothetical protein FTUN_8429 [Frigoriglobus tundricola]|uniref:Uncharacterized protein n=1 Tax=Frigoriglobus tundricola TaxID=2774151 RepID=A0A6M5Z5U5_9BACT|nr:hypothetical protein FTUN_8429 [Frigoriglobus tundricola]
MLLQCGPPFGFTVRFDLDLYLARELVLLRETDDSSPVLLGGWTFEFSEFLFRSPPIAWPGLQGSARACLLRCFGTGADTILPRTNLD